MESLIEAAILGLYFPIVVFSGVACWLLIARLLWPAVKDRTLHVDRYAIALSAAFALAAHAAENTYYGIARWTDNFQALQALWIVGAWKMLIMSSGILAVAALSRASTDGAHVRRLIGIALALWFVASIVAWILA